MWFRPAFGKQGGRYLRLSYATGYNQLDEALDWVKKAATVLMTA